MLIKWRLMLTSLPYVAFAVLVKFGLERGLDFKGVIEFSDVGLVLTGGVFLVGFMLAGTMADYKESEKIPAELACILETIEETFAQAVASKPGLDEKALRESLWEVSQGTHDWFYKKLTQERLFQRLEALSKAIHTLEKAGAGGYASRALSELHNLRKTLSRVAVISRTGFLASGYALLETLTTAIVLLLMISKFKSEVAEIILIAFVSLIFTYMLRLIRDIDDPFEYSADGAKGAAEVELFPLEEYLVRAKSRLS
jgi:hypothetical protein